MRIESRVGRKDDFLIDGLQRESKYVFLCNGSLSKIKKQKTYKE